MTDTASAPDEQPTIVVAYTQALPQFYRKITGPRALEWLSILANALVFGLPMLLVVIVAVRTGDRALLAVMVGAIIVALLLWRQTLRIFARASWRHLRESPTGPLSNTWVLDDQGVTITDGTFCMTLRWGGIAEVREEPGCLVFVTGPSMGHVLPIRFLDAGANQLGQIRALVGSMKRQGRIGTGS